MTITFLDLYNEVAGQAWSMFDPDAESEEDFETGLKTSINKALSYLWNCYPHIFKLKNKVKKTTANKANYTLPDGNIVKKVINDKTVYGIKIDKTYLEYCDEYESLEEKTGTPESFYVYGNNFYLYPTPDAEYNINVEYYSLPLGFSTAGAAIYELSNDDDYLDIPEKYESIFKNALITLSMMYAIASETDENYIGYKTQFDKAYEILINQQRGIDKDKKVFW